MKVTAPSSLVSRKGPLTPALSPSDGERGKASPRHAFSLLELLVAVGLLGVIMVALMMAFQQVQRALHTGLNQVDVLENGRAIMTLLSRDVQELTFSEDTNCINFYACPRMAPTNALGFNSALDDLFVLTRGGDEWRSIKYTFQPESSPSGATVDWIGTLYRKINTTNTVPYANLHTVSTFSVTNVTGAAPLGENFHPVADGVVLFRVQALDFNGLPYGPFRTNDLTIILAGPDYPFAIPEFPFYSFGNTNLPAFVEIELGILEPQTLQQFQAKLAADPSGNIATAFLKQRAGKVHLFRQRIPIRSRYRGDL